MAQKFPFPVNPTLTGISIAYRNTALIADAVLPRTTVTSEQFKWMEYAKEERFTVPETNVGRKSRTNQVEFGATERTGSTADYGLEDAIPQKDIDAASEATSQYDPIEHATEAMTDLILLDREIRVAELVMDPAQYDGDHKMALATPWSSPEVDAIEHLLEAIEGTFQRSNVVVFGHEDWRAFRRNPYVIKAVLGNSGDSGIATRAQVAELFELDEVVVGQGRVNNARKGQAPQFNRVWDGTLAFFRNRLANNERGLTFGYTAQFGDRVAGDWEDKDIGLRGGRRVRTGESVGEILAARDVGYLITGAS